MHALDEEYLTVPEAATLLRVAPSTIRRWIREGDVPAYRIGRRRVALKRGELTALVTPLRAAGDHVTSLNGEPIIPRRKLTPEEKQRALEAMDRAERHAKELQVQRGGEPFSSSWEELNEMRDERTRQLG